MTEFGAATVFTQFLGPVDLEGSVGRRRQDDLVRVLVVLIKARRPFHQILERLFRNAQESIATIEAFAIDTGRQLVSLGPKLPCRRDRFAANDWNADPRKPAPGPSLGSDGIEATAVGSPGTSGVSFFTTVDQPRYLSDWLGGIAAAEHEHAGRVVSGM